jgi:NADH dehydrogenase FAD-containing subunit
LGNLDLTKFRYSHVAKFKRLDSNEDIEIKYCSLHFTPATYPDPQVKASPLVSGSGLIDVHRFTLQHNKHKNIFALGECANIPHRTVAGTVLGQAPVVAWNVLSQLAGKNGKLKYYDGWHTSPIMTSLSKYFKTNLADEIIRSQFLANQNQLKRNLLARYKKITFCSLSMLGLHIFLTDRIFL